MTISSLTSEMMKSFVKLSKAEQKRVLKIVKTFLRSKENQFIPQTLEEYNTEINEAVTAFKRGEFTCIEQLEEEMKSW